MRIGACFISNISGDFSKDVTISAYTHEKSVKKEFEYMANLGIENLIMLNDKPGVKLGKKYFNDVTVVFAAGANYSLENLWDKDIIYAWDEPEGTGVRPNLSAVYDVIRTLHREGYKVEITFWNIDSARSFLSGCDAETYPDVVGYDYYPVRILHHIGDPPIKHHLNMDGFREGVSQMRDLVKGDFVAYVQTCGKPLAWKYPTLEVMEDMFEYCRGCGVDIMRLFLWSTCYKAPELLSGLDITTVDYHDMIKSFIDKG